MIISVKSTLKINPLPSANREVLIACGAHFFMNISRFYTAAQMSRIYLFRNDHGAAEL
jgi:hypothetical protein